MKIWFNLWCLTPLSTILLFQLYRGCHRPVQVTDKLYHIIWNRVHLAQAGFELTTLVLIGIDCTVSCKSNYHTIKTMMAPVNVRNFIVYISITWGILLLDIHYTSTCLLFPVTCMLTVRQFQGCTRKWTTRFLATTYVR